MELRLIKGKKGVDVCPRTAASRTTRCRSFGGARPPVVGEDEALFFVKLSLAVKAHRDLESNEKCKHDIRISLWCQTLDCEKRRDFN